MVFVETAYSKQIAADESVLYFHNYNKDTKNNSIRDMASLFLTCTRGCIWLLDKKSNTIFIHK